MQPSGYGERGGGHNSSTAQGGGRSYPKSSRFQSSVVHVKNIEAILKRFSKDNKMYEDANTQLKTKIELSSIDEIRASIVFIQGQLSECDEDDNARQKRLETLLYLFISCGHVETFTGVYPIENTSSDKENQYNLELLLALFVDNGDHHSFERFINSTGDNIFKCIKSILLGYMSQVMRAIHNVNMESMPGEGGYGCKRGASRFMRAYGSRMGPLHSKESTLQKMFEIFYNTEIRNVFKMMPFSDETSFN